MSEVSILLPASSIGVFVQNKKLKEDIVSLSDDWRFPSVHIDVIDGNVDRAISTYKSQETHDLIIIETLSIDDDFSNKLEDLSEYCNENTAAIIIGPENDVNLYRKLMDMGISDYLVHPIEKNALSDVIAKALIDRIGTADSKLITVLGVKGGVGTSAIAQTLSLVGSENFGKKTLLMDAAGGASYTSVSFGDEPITTLKEAARAALAEDEGSMKRMLVDVSDNLTILASGGEPVLEEAIQLSGFDDVLNRVMATYPAVIFDASASSVQIKKSAIMRSHDIYLVTTPTLSGLRATRMYIQEIKSLRGDNDNGPADLIHVILNMKGQFSGQEISKSEAEKAIEHDIDMVIDFDPKLFPAAEIDGKKITELKNSDKLVSEFTDNLSSVLGSSKKPMKDDNKGFLDGFIGKLKG